MSFLELLNELLKLIENLNNFFEMKILSLSLSLSSLFSFLVRVKILKRFVCVHVKVP